MCGINAIIGIEEENNALFLLQKMNKKLSHRGPDSEGVFFSNGVALGHRRLSIIDLSEDGKQPMLCNDKRFVIVFNGEIYNYKALREELSGSYIFKTNTDTEVLLAAYTIWGYACLKKLEGMFAFLVYDTREKKIFGARDRLGIKPLYYTNKNNTWAFSSETRALLQSAVTPPKINKLKLPEYLAYQTVQAPDTIIENVFMLEPGKYFTLDNGIMEQATWWQPVSEILTEKDVSYKDATTKVKELFYHAVEKRLVADVPFGAFLSGGIDSSAVVAAMSSVSSVRTETFNISFDESELSEAKYAAAVAKRFNTKHHEIKLSPNNFLEMIPEALKAFDHPGMDGVNTWVVSRAAKQAGITMALSGTGGDEVFGGYPFFKTYNKLNYFAKLPLLIRKPFAAAAARKATSNPKYERLAAILSLDTISTATVLPLIRTAIGSNRIQNLTNASFLPHKVLFKDLANNNHSLSFISINEMHFYLQNVLLRDTDQMSMAHALEVRVPFLDHKLVEFVMALPDNYKYPKTPKKLLTDAMGNELGTEITNRKKMGFVLPWDKWMRNELKDFVRKRMELLIEKELFNEMEIRKLWDDFYLNRNQSVRWINLWNLVVLSDWIETNGIEA